MKISMKGSGLRWIAPISMGVCLALTGSLLTVPPATAAATSVATTVGTQTTAPESDTETAPDVVSARVAAIAQGHKVEILSERTEEAMTWVNPDGSFTTSTSDGPVRIEDSSAKDGWRDLDYTLVKNADGTVGPKSGYRAITLSGKASASEVAADGVVTVTTKSKKDISFGWDGALPAPALDGDTATYADVQPNTDLVVELTATGFEQYFVLKEKPATDAAIKLEIPLLGDDLDATKTTAGGVKFTDSTNQTVGTIPAPYMSDSGADQGDGADKTAKLAIDVADQADGSQSLVLSPSASFLADPTVTYPVVIDPAITLNPSFDTYVQSNATTTDFSTATELHVGIQTNGGAQTRSFLNFDASAFRAAKVTDAKLTLYQTQSTTCTATPLTVTAAESASSSTRWPAQPGINAAQTATISVSKGYSTACPEGSYGIDVTGLTDFLASQNSASIGMRLTASETDRSGWKNINSADNTAHKPNLVVTYNRYPATAAVAQIAAGQTTSYNGRIYSTSLTPTFTSSVTDPDNNNTLVRYEVHTSQSDGDLLGSCDSGGVASGAAATCVFHSLPGAGTYYVRTLGQDGSLWSKSWSAWFTFKVALAAPQAGSINCPGYANGSWTTMAPSTAVSCSITLPATDDPSGAARVLKTIDLGSQTSTTITQGAAATIPFTVPNANGAHHIEVLTVAPSGSETETTYDFGFGGSPSMSSPGANTKTNDTLAVTGAGYPAGASDVAAHIEWRVANTGATGWTTDPAKVPLNVGNGGEAVTVTNYAWSTQSAKIDTSTGTSVTLDARVPVLLEIRLCFDYSKTGTHCSDDASSARTIVRVPHAFGNGYPTSDAGPGQVALWTGEFNTTETDATVPTPDGELTISRSHSTFEGPPSTVTGGNGVFGPGWTAAFDGAGAGTAGFQVVDDTSLDGTISLFNDEGDPLVFQEPGGGNEDAKVGTYLPFDADTKSLEVSLSVAGSGYNKILQLKESDGTITTWNVIVGRTPIVWMPLSVTENPTGSAALTTSYTTDASGRVTRILAPVAAGLDCSTMVAGCRSLDIAYGVAGSSTLATSSTNGDFTGQVKSVSFNAYDPATSTMRSVPVASYTYAANGTLASVTDPRSGLGTTYTYDTDSLTGKIRLTGQQDSGLAAYHYQYGSSRLQAVTRDGAATGDPTATLATFIYDIAPASMGTAAGLPALTASDVSIWSQQAAPSYGAAAFGADYTPPSTNPAALTANDWKYASLQYTDNRGYTVNSAEYGAGAWQISATDYDAVGNISRNFDRQATHDMRARYAASPGVSFDAGQYATINRYNAAQTIVGTDVPSVTVTVPVGTYLTDTWAPAQYAVMADGSSQFVRAHVHLDYDQGAPNNGVNQTSGVRYGLVTTTTTGAAAASSGSSDIGVSIPADLSNLTTSRSGYAPIDDAALTSETSGWTLGKATTNTTDMGGSAQDITERLRYDKHGVTKESRSPLSQGGDAGDTSSVDYSVGANTADAQCGTTNPQWDGLPCWSGPAVDASGNGQPDLPDSRVTSYTMLLAPRVTVETSGSGATLATRTTTNTYLADGRLESAVTTVNGQVSSTPEPKTVTLYDSNSGLVKGTQSVDPSNGAVLASTSSSYDKWGREISSTNFLGDVSTTQYVDPGHPGAGSVLASIDAKGLVAYVYDGLDANNQQEQRGLVTSIAVGGTGGSTLTYKAAYDANGDMVLQTAPGGISESYSYDPNGNLTSQTYSGASASGGTTSWLSWTQKFDLSGRVVSDTTPDGTLGQTPGSGGHSYTFDRAGRLTVAQDSTAPAGCVTRSYAFDQQGNRTALTTSGPATTGTCATGAASTAVTSKAWTYDLSSRVLTAGTGSAPYTYDAFGRVTTLPAEDAPTPSAGAVTLGYYDMGEPRSIAQNGVTTSFTLDSDERRISETVATGATVSKTLVRHYADGSDDPSWIDETAGGTTTTSRYTPSISGDLGAVWESGVQKLTISNPHGDVVTTITVPSSGNASSINGWSSTDEYGSSIAAPGDTGAATYGWLGSAERATMDTGLLLMGARIYNPATGRFLSPDPEVGGNENAYNYPNDPVNMRDTTGLFAAVLAAPLLLGGPVGWAILGAVVVVGGGVLLYQASKKYHWFDKPKHHTTHHSVAHTTYARSGVRHLTPAKKKQAERAASRGGRPAAVASSPEPGQKPGGGKKHTKGARPSTLQRHQEGEKRTEQDAPGGEKGDARRPYRRK